MAIYTRTGDKGKTSLMGGKRVLKSDPRVEAYGTVDELNSAIGVAIAEVPTSKSKITNVSEELKAIQNDLLDIGSALATPEGVPVEHLENRPQDFEKLIDAMTNELPPLSHFILPGGSVAGSHLHLARTICRRAERRIVSLMQVTEIEQPLVIYLNRLSDLLFTMARFVNHIENQKETIWKKH
jgi:cob(I)alamin adenosyltransferase